jgi:cbb3-type cytochrome oxidase subunit 1
VVARASSPIRYSLFAFFEKEKTMKASTLSFQAAVIFVIAGMIWGIVMAISENHSNMPAHAHLNLLGWVSLFLFGIYYRLHPALEGATSALVQVGGWIVATIILAIGVGLATSGHPVGEPIAAIGSFVALFDMLLFGWLVFAGARGKSPA